MALTFSPEDSFSFRYKLGGGRGSYCSVSVNGAGGPNDHCGRDLRLIHSVRSVGRPNDLARHRHSRRPLHSSDIVVGRKRCQLARKELAGAETFRQLD